MSKIIKKYILFSVLAFFILGSFILQDLNGQDIEYPQDNAITLENGLRVVVREDHRNPIVVFSVLVNVGSAWEGEYLGSGISHLVEHVLFKGTAKYPMGRIEDILHTYGGDIDGYTTHDYTGFSITILKEHKDIALDVLREMLTVPAFDPKELKKEMSVIEREMDLNRDDPSRRISTLTFSNAFIMHPYRIPVIGYKQNFKQLTRNDVIKFFKMHYGAGHIIISVAGDISKDEILKDIKAYFGKIREDNFRLHSHMEEPPQITARFVEEKADINNAYLNIAFHSTDLFDKDLYAMDVVSFILGIGESSILNERLRLKEQLVLSISASNYTPKEPGLFIISCVLKEENIHKALGSILNQIEMLKSTGIKEEDLIKAKNNFLASYVYQKETIEAQANDLAISEMLTSSADFFKKYIERIKSVSSEDIKAATLKYLNKEHMTVVCLSKSGRALKIGTEETSASKQENNVNKIILSNGLNVLLTENHSLPLVSLSVLFKAGLRSENENNNGISMLTSSMLIDGTDAMTKDRLVRTYESKGMSVDTYSGNNSMGILVTCLKEHTEDALMLLSDICTKSVFPEEELKREKSELASAIDMQDNQIFNHGHRLLKKSLFKLHPYGLETIGTRESVNKLTRAMVMDFYKNILSADNMVIGISGDFSADKINPVLEKYFSDIPGKKPGPVIPEKEPPLAVQERQIAETDKDQSIIILGFHGMSIFNPDKYAANVLVNILSSASGRLFKSIREKKGFSYSVGAFNVLGMDPGYIVIYSLTSKDNIQTVENQILKEIYLLIKNGPMEDELQKSKNYLKAMRKIEMQTNSSFISSISMDELYGLGYNNYKDFDNKIDNLAKEDIKKAAKKYLTLDKCAIVILKGRI